MKKKCTCDKSIIPKWPNTYHQILWPRFRYKQHHDGMLCVPFGTEKRQSDRDSPLQMMSLHYYTPCKLWAWYDPFPSTSGVDKNKLSLWWIAPGQHHFLGQCSRLYITLQSKKYLELFSSLDKLCWKSYFYQMHPIGSNTINFRSSFKKNRQENIFLKIGVNFLCF